MAALIDIDTLNAFTMNDSDLQHELFDLYFNQSEHYLDLLRESVGKESDQLWRDATHGLKGAARSLGLLHVNEVVHDLEGKGPSHINLAQIEDVLDKTHDAVIGLRDKRG